jgi:thiol-disulfide isomerase/thioredoxin
MKNFRKIIFIVILLLITHPGFPQDTHPVSWKISSEEIAPLVYKVKFEATIKEPYHIYPQQSSGGGLGMPTKFLFDKDPDLELIGDMEEKEAGKPTGMDVAYYSKGVTFIQTIKLRSERKTTLSLTIKYMACTNTMCLPPSAKRFTLELGKKGRASGGDKSEPPVNNESKQDVPIAWEDFVMGNTEGKLIPSRDITSKAKYTFIDFWASWCMPCRAQGRELIPIYEKYKPMGLAVIGVSFDTDTTAWKRAINSDRYTWTNLSDGKGFNSPLSIKYRITAIPRNFLIDQNGVIVSRDLHGPELAAKLAELFN